MKKNSNVLSLKYRPQSFNDLVGQEVISEALSNSIKLKKTPNAYLFTGIRGVGKTTIARIIAKSLNCTSTSNLCQRDFCENCKSIINSNHIDVLEMDAASKTGVDDVRDLIEFSKYPPNIAKYKIFIIDEVHMLSKQAFNALLKTLEEPPEYLKFIFATTEIKKIPVTIISRCQRYDLSRVKFEVLLDYLKTICKLENAKVNSEALKLIVKLSEGSVRDALSLLDRGLLSNENNELNLETAQNIFGFFDKSTILELIEEILKGNESSVKDIYKRIFEKGVEPKTFLNEFLEILYYIKNISSLKIDGNVFSLNDNEYKKINLISKNINIKEIFLFWHATLKTIEEINFVNNQHLSLEMFLIKLIYLKSIKIEESKIEKKKGIKYQDLNLEIKENKSINQIKKTTQEEISPEVDTNEISGKNIIQSFDNLIKLCHEKKEIKLKYDLENNINLVSFKHGLIEIAFNERLDKNFIKDLTNKLYIWTNSRWIISLSKEKGDLSSKDKKRLIKLKAREEIKNSKIYEEIKSLYPDAELLDIIKEKDD